MNPRSFLPPKRHTGVSLVELLVSLVIGLIVVLVVVNIFVMSKTSAALAEGRGRVHENGIIGMDYLQDDLRMIGHFGCVSDQALDTYLQTTFDTSRSALNFNISVQGYEAANTAPSNAINVTSLSTGGTGFSPTLPADLATIVSDRVNTSDIIAVRYLNPRSVLTTTTDNATFPTITFPTAQWNAIADFDTTAGLMAISDCSSTTVFQASNANASAGSIKVLSSGLNTRGFTQVYENQKARLYGATSVVYYVGKSANQAFPSLYRVRFVSSPGGALQYQKDELIKGVESMQILYGQDRSTTTRLTGFMDRQQTAAAIHTSLSTPQLSWRRVGMVKVGLLLVDPNRSSSFQRGGDEFGDTGTISLQGVNVTVPADQHYRLPLEATVALRNRLYGN